MTRWLGRSSSDCHRGRVWQVREPYPEPNLDGGSHPGLLGAVGNVCEGQGSPRRAPESPNLGKNENYYNS